MKSESSPSTIVYLIRFMYKKLESHSSDVQGKQGHAGMAFPLRCPDGVGYSTAQYWYTLEFSTPLSKLLDPVRKDTCRRKNSNSGNKLQRFQSLHTAQFLGYCEISQVIDKFAHVIKLISDRKNVMYYKKNICYNNTCHS